MPTPSCFAIGFGRGGGSHGRSLLQADFLGSAEDFFYKVGGQGRAVMKVFPVPELVAGSERSEGKRRKGMAQLK